jgi:hypothetical protein
MRVMHRLPDILIMVSECNRDFATVIRQIIPVG